MYEVPPWGDGFVEENNHKKKIYEFHVQKFWAACDWFYALFKIWLFLTQFCFNLRLFHFFFPEQRKKDASKIREKYPQRIPVRLDKFWFLRFSSLVTCFSLFIYQVVVERVKKSNIADIDKHKFLVPHDISVAQFIWIIRKRIHLPPERSLFLFVGKVIPQTRWVPYRRTTWGEKILKEKEKII